MIKKTNKLIYDRKLEKVSDKHIIHNKCSKISRSMNNIQNNILTPKYFLYRFNQISLSLDMLIL